MSVEPKERSFKRFLMPIRRVLLFKFRNVGNGYAKYILMSALKK